MCNWPIRDAALETWRGGGGWGGGGGVVQKQKKKSCKAQIEKKNSCIAKNQKKNILQGKPMRLCIHITQFVKNMPVVGSFLPSFPQQLYQ